MVPTHRTTVLLSNVFHLMSFQRATQIAAACVKHTHPITRTAFLLTFAFARCGRLGHLLCAEKAHGVESAVVEGGGVGGFPPPKAALVYLVIFQEVTYFVGWAGAGVEARLLHISCCWIARRWSRCSEAVGLLASTLQPGTMSPESLKFVLLTALQALYVCDGLVSKPDEGKS